MAVKRTDTKEPVIELTKSEEKKVKKVEEPTVEVKSEPVIEVAPIEEKNVKIRMNQDHKCHIGGEFYGLVKGECYTVPQNVKDVLNRAGLLAPL